jgi:hypothetical protein
MQTIERSPKCAEKRFYMNHSINPYPDTDPKADPEFCASTSIRTLSLSKGLMENTRFLQLLDALIDNIFKRLEDNSVQPKIRDALKAIQLRQKVAKSSETEKIFWELIESIRTDELNKIYPRILNLEDQIINTIIGLKQQVKNGILPVKTITDTFNQGRSKESKLTYHRIGRLLSSLGFRKAKTHAGTYAILWDDDLLFQNKFSEDEKNEKQPSASPASPACL